MRVVVYVENKLISIHAPAGGATRFGGTGLAVPG